MNRFRVLPVLVLFGSAGFCQAAGNHATTVFKMPAEKAFCPVALRASWARTNVGFVPIKSEPGTPQSLKVTLQNPEPVTVSKSRVTVFGFPPGVRIDPAVAYMGGGNPAEKAKSFTIEQDIDTDQTTSTHLSIPGVGMITRITLDSLVYADGSTWQPVDHHPCQALTPMIASD
jgi:hypothetical protein